MILISSAWSSPEVISAVVSLLIAGAAYLKAKGTDSKVGDVHAVVTSEVGSLRKDKADALQKVADLTGTTDAQEAATRAQNNYAAHVAAMRDITPEDVMDYNGPLPPATKLK